MVSTAEEIYADVFSASEVSRNKVSYIQQARNLMFVQLQVSEFFPHCSKSFTNLPLTAKLHRSLQLQDSRGHPTDNFTCLPEFALFHQVFKTLRSDYKRHPGVRDAVERLGIYLNEEKRHWSCLSKMKKDNKLSEKKMQAVLAHHVFEPLAESTEIILDKYSRKNSSDCPYCNNTMSNIRYGCTSFGHKKLWHGRADMVIRNEHSRQIVTVTDAESETENDEPLVKKARTEAGDSCPLLPRIFHSESILKGEKHDHPPFTQIVSQTIVNAFLAVKQNKNLDKYFIPCFLAHKRGIMGVLYNVHNDTLLSSCKSISLIRDDHLAKEDILSTWIMLNYYKFQLDITSDKISKLLEQSGFRDEALKHDVLAMYESDLEENFDEHFTTYIDKEYNGVVDTVALKLVDIDDGLTD